MRNRGIALTIMAAAIFAVACGSDNAPTGTAAVVSVTVSQPTANILEKGGTATLTATTKDAGGNTITGTTVTWSSSSDAIATVSAAGLVTGVAPGTATITATSNGKTGTATVTVVSRTVTFSVQMTPAAEPGTLNGNPTGSGTFNATLDTTSNVFTWNGTFSGLTSNVNNGHIHGPFIAGTTGTASVILNFNPSVTPGATFVGLNSATSGSVTGSVVLTATLSLTSTINGDSLKKLLLAGAAYVNIHTLSNTGGEIRAQLIKK
jgi:hypothetical protein